MENASNGSKLFEGCCVQEGQSSLNLQSQDSTPAWVCQDLLTMRAGLLQSHFSGGVWGGEASPKNIVWWLSCGKAARQPPEKRVRAGRSPVHSRLCSSLDYD